MNVHINSIAADALGATRIGGIAMELAQRYAVGSVLVGDDAIAMAGSTCGGSSDSGRGRGATALAAIQSGRMCRSRGAAVVMLCGANTDPTTL